MQKREERKKKWLFLVFHRRAMVALMILAQIAFLALAITAWARRPGVALGMWGFTVVVIVYVLLRHGERAAFLPWIVLCLAFPIFGGLFYFAFHLGASSPALRRAVRGIEESLLLPAASSSLSEAAAMHPKNARLMRYLSSSEKFPVYGGRVAYLPSGEDFLASLAEALSKAEKYIFLEYFIVEEGVMWEHIYEILRRKAAEGVLIRVMYDDVGCLLRLPSDFPKRLRADGMECAVFNPFRPMLSGLQNNRDHRKIAVIDGEIAFTGGANLADEYINEIHPFGHWKDAAVRIEGEAARAFAAIFLQNWCLCLGREEPLAPFIPQASSPVDSESLVQPYADSPLDANAVGEGVYLAAIASAEKRLYITTPYFIVGDNILKALVAAAKSGVDVRIVTPRIWDKRLVHAVTRSYYPALIAGGVRVYEYAEGFIHSKTLTADGNLSIVGTTNFDYRSLYYHFECGAVIYGEKVASALESDFSEILARSREITAGECKKGVIGRFIAELLRIFAPMM